MYLDTEESLALSESISSLSLPRETEGAVFPTSLSFSAVWEKLANSAWCLGAQNVSWMAKGAYTGAVSALIFKDAGAKYALVGHSERRYIFGERDVDVRKKIEAGLEAGLIPVLCVGETKEDKDAGKRQYRLKKQLFTALADLSLNDRSIIVAYEPVWAISQGGKGEACAPADAEDVQGWIKLEMRQYSRQTIPVLYGGSVNPNNAGSYLALSSVDGLLVGSAATTLESVRSLLQAFQT